MLSEYPAILINDDEVEFKLIYVYSNRSNKMRKYTISQAEQLGLVQVDAGSFQMGGNSCSKVVTIIGKNIKLFLSTKT